MTGSDFAAEFFSDEENKSFETILRQLRSFERSVAQSFRHVEERLDLIEKNVKKNNDGLTGTKGLITDLRKNITDLQTNFEEKMNKTVKLGKNYKNKIFENFEEEEDSSIDESDLTIREMNETDNNNIRDTREAYVTDPFIGNGAFVVGTFDGNPTVSFTKWIEKFKDVLSLMTEPTEAQKLLRLRFCLAGQARIAFDEIDPQPNTLAEAINILKRKYENGNSKIIARQKLSNCRQAPGESVFEFANRLSDTVRTTLSGEEEETIKKRLLDEFLDRLLPDLQFEVKAQRPLEFDNAYEIAQNYELLLKARKDSYNNIFVANLAEKVEALTIQSNIQNNKKKKIICFNCKKAGHIARNCFFLKPDLNQRNYRPQHFGRYEDRSWQNNKNYKRNNNYFNENRPYRDENYQRNNRSNNRIRNYENYDSSSSLSSRSSSSERENNSPELGSNNYCNRSPNRGERFERNRSPRIGRVSPFMLVILALFCLIGSTFSAPMSCFNDAPITIWRLQNDPIFPKFTIGDDINILKNKTPTFENECAKTDVNKCRGFSDSYIQRDETLNQFSILVFSCFVTVLFVLKFVLRSILAGPINYLNIGEAIYSRIKSYRKKNKRMKRTKQIKNKIKSNESELKENKIPLSKRWPSRNKIGRGDLNKNRQNNIKNLRCGKYPV
uniref:CCHC-type domain-containing protein n=1 Tax=Meloidogyne enterolobii TaxID=390850 RepID=A0A6V7XJX7_MELEN|nr:unnamed protein product [Meloidogyne enterolobii]